MNREMRMIVFRDNTHILNWLEYSRSFSRPGDYMNRMFNLEHNLAAEIRKLAIYTEPCDADEFIDVLRGHLRIRWRAVQRLDELRIIFDVPRITNPAWKTTRTRQENNVCHTVYQLTHVNRVVIQNIYYRSDNDFVSDTMTRRWNVLMWEDDDDRINDDR
ncbi:hypothetical protein CC86DRAFT_122407 [Ophiobolus disseminans]|uniref:Uncharacterized protein n=1 Tax=Ophiobolus disseminans TaxID=1469910 RepID=A0A6A6ZHX8_9PLEO|nr:hypothetical protein CC86DRAFT_122407 [Ophiobolus disseminans]